MTSCGHCDCRETDADRRWVCLCIRGLARDRIRRRADVGVSCQHEGRLVLTPHGHSWASLVRNRYISPIKVEMTRLISSRRRVLGGTQDADLFGTVLSDRWNDQT